MVMGTVLGLMFLAAGWFLRVRLRPGEVVTAGVVVECESFRRYATRYYRLVVEFKDQTMMRRRFVPEDDQEESRKALGTRVRIGYLPEDPEGTARQVDGAAQWVPWFAVGLGAVSLLLSAAGALA